MKNIILTVLIATISIMTAAGVFVHDSRIDTAVGAHAQWKSKNQPMVYDLGSQPDPHTHPAHTKAPFGGSQSSNPSYPPREQRMKRYILQNAEPRGRHAFDSYYLPVIG